MANHSVIGIVAAATLKVNKELGHALGSVV